MACAATTQLELNHTVTSWTDVRQATLLAGNNVQVVIVAPHPSDQLLAAITSRKARGI
jgi:hypothetical protein